MDATYWTPAWATVFFAVLAGIGLLALRHRIGRSERLRSFAYARLVLPAAAVAVALLLVRFATDRVQIDSQRVVERSLFGSRGGLYLHALQTVEVSKASYDRAGRGRRRPDVWTGTYGDGYSSRVEPGIAWTSHSEEVIARLRERGVTVQHMR